VAHQNNQIAEARKDFVCVRIGQMNDVDLARFEFDYDTTWSSFFLDANRNVYSRYGGRDHRAADARMNTESLIQTMSEVLAIHRGLQQVPLADRPASLLKEIHPTAMLASMPKVAAKAGPVTAPVATPEDIPLLRENHEGCVHCHQIQEYRHLQNFHDGKFDRSQLFGYPLPENLGIRMTQHNGHLIESIIDDSAAARAGLRAGDLLDRVNSIPIRSEYDFRWALHQSRNDEPIALVVRRGASGKAAQDAARVVVELTLQPPLKWRQSDLGWRKSLRSVPLRLGFLGYTLGGEGLKQAGFPAEKSVLKVLSIRAPGLAENVKLQKGDLITAVGDQHEFQSLDRFKSRLLELYQPGDRVKLEVIRDGRTIQLEGTFPEWFTTDNSVP